MQLSHRWFTRAALVLAASGALSFASVAQSAARTGAPVAGTWGGEAAVGDGQSASLLLFQSARWALLAGGSTRSFSTSSFAGASNRLTVTSLRVGARRYGGAGLGMRPVVGLGLAVAGATRQNTQLGAYGEIGALYFFNPHLSLGVTSEASFGGQEGGGTSFGVSLARLIGTVYF